VLEHEHRSDRDDHEREHQQRHGDRDDRFGCHSESAPSLGSTLDTRRPWAFKPARVRVIVGAFMAVVDVVTSVDRALEQGAKRLLSLQRPDGYWVGELESNATITAEHIFWLHFLNLRDPETDRRIANELLARMREDGTWSIWWDGPPDISVTVEAYVALRMCGVDPGARTHEYIVRSGGVRATRVFTRCWLALLGEWPWQALPPVPVETVLLPPSAPFSIYDLACWARQTVVPLSVVMALRPERRSGVDLRDIGARPGESRRARRPNALRRHAIQVAEQWVRERQEADGSWGGIQPPWVWSLAMLAALGYGPEDESLARGIKGWEGFMVDDGDRLRPEACQSPVWDTGLAVLGLCAAGVPADHPALVRAAEWLLAEEVTGKGDWSVRVPELAPGGWAFEFQNDLYPDVDDAAVIALALRQLGVGDDAVRRGLDWVAGMQSSNGGWGAFDVDNDSEWLYRIPFFDFGAVIDPPSVDVSAHALEALAPEGVYGRAVTRGLDYLFAEQEDDGSWFGRWGANHVYGTGAALPALEACGIPDHHPAVRRAVEWLDTVQAPDGGFGENILSYGNPVYRGRGTPSTASQTAWALLGYVAAGDAGRGSALRAAGHLVRSQRPDGDWDEEHFTGTGFPLDFMIRYHLYRITFPLLALGRFRASGVQL
jgi:squalene-hopene/tetraprenyl-beta-curcumene cyclase